ncbi:MAG: TolC family outer membrane protein [Sulfurisoma sp.]|nr:TolC family outer membrane protein [Sulfurisoma sp.]
MKPTLFAACIAGLVSAAPAHALDLLAAYRLALTGDANYQVARAATKAAREAIPQARAGLLPQISLSASRSRNDTDQTTETVLGPSSARYDYSARSAAFSVRQPLLRMANVAQYFQAEAQVDAAEATLEKETQGLAVRVAGAYFDALVSLARLDTAGAQKDAYAAQLKSAERGLKAGTGTRTDIDEAQARFDMALAQEIDARQGVDLAERALASVLGQRVAASGLAMLSPERLKLELPEPATIEPWLSQAEENNPELRSLRATVEAARREVDKNRAYHLPTVDLVASRNNSSNENNYSIGSNYWTNSVGVQLNIPIFSGGQVNSAVRQSLANLDKARQQHEAARRQLDVNVAKEFSAVTQGVARIRALEQALRSTEQALVSTRKGIQAGTRNTVDVLNAEQQVTTSRLELAQARATYAAARLRLKVAAGTLTEADIATVSSWLSTPL